MLNTIKIQRIRNTNSLMIHSKNKFFKCKELTITIKEGVVKLRKPTLSDQKVYTVNDCNGYRNSITISNQFLKEGIFDIDPDDSTEDELVIYLDLL